MFLRHDYIETSEGLLFAVVENGLEDGRALCFLRYVRRNGRWQKLDTRGAGELLANEFPQYLFHSHSRDAALHGVPGQLVRRRFQPRELAARLLLTAGDELKRKAQTIVKHFVDAGVRIDALGITGSLLVGAHTPNSDVDIVLYDREAFHHARRLLRLAIESGPFAALTPLQWEDTWRRRGCSLTRKEYIWHERRKWNKAVCEGTKFDISLASDAVNRPCETCRKLGSRTIVAQVTDDSDAFAFPSKWKVDDREITEVASFTPTFNGQAQTGEFIEARGSLEQSSTGAVRIVVGSSREASGEWIKVVTAPAPQS